MNLAPNSVLPSDALAVIEFWRSAGPQRWFAKDADFDARFRNEFLSHHEGAARGDYAEWTCLAFGALALAILLDQFPRNAFRGTPRMYATDEMARAVARAAIKAGCDRQVEDDLALFLYLPFGHSESLADQEWSVDLMNRFGELHRTHAHRHYDIIKRFGRFPHRNAILGRSMTVAEQQYLDNGGYAG